MEYKNEEIELETKKPGNSILSFIEVSLITVLMIGMSITIITMTQESMDKKTLQIKQVLDGSVSANSFMIESLYGLLGMLVMWYVVWLVNSNEEKKKIETD